MCVCVCGVCVCGVCVCGVCVVCVWCVCVYAVRWPTAYACPIQTAVGSCPVPTFDATWNVSL